MKLTCKSLCGEFTIDVSENIEANVKHALAIYFNVHPYRISLFPYENIDYGVVIQSPQWKLLDWIPLTNLSWQSLSTNPRAISLLEQYPEKIHWDMLCINPEAIHLLEQHPDNIIWHQLAANPNAISLLESYLEKSTAWKEDTVDNYLFWTRLSENPNAFPLLEKYLPHVRFYQLMHSNPSPDTLPFLEKHLPNVYQSISECVSQISHRPDAISLLEMHKDRVSWSHLSENPAAISLLENNPDRICWMHLSKNPNAIPLLEKNMDKIAWYYLCENPNALPLLTQHMDKICWSFLCKNKNPEVMEFLEQHLDKIDSDPLLECQRDGLSLSRNPAALPLLYRHRQFVNWNVLGGLPEIFEWCT